MAPRSQVSEFQGWVQECAFWISFLILGCAPLWNPWSNCSTGWISPKWQSRISNGPGYPPCFLSPFCRGIIKDFPQSNLPWQSLSKCTKCFLLWSFICELVQEDVNSFLDLPSFPSFSQINKCSQLRINSELKIQKCYITGKNDFKIKYMITETSTTLLASTDCECVTDNHAWNFGWKPKETHKS